MSEKKAAMYVRVSTDEQETDMQEVELRDYCEKRGWTCVLYRDKAQSGAKNDRPALNTMLSDMRRRRFDDIAGSACGLYIRQDERLRFHASRITEHRNNSRTDNSLRRN